MKLYETVFLIAPNLPEEENQALIEKMAAIVTEKKGTMVNLDNWGKRRLAYPIEKFEEAFYVFFLYKSEADLPLELERRFKQTESVIRFLTVKQDEGDNIRKPRKRISRGPRNHGGQSYRSPRPASAPETKAVEKTPAEPDEETKEN